MKRHSHLILAGFLLFFNSYPLKAADIEAILHTSDASSALNIQNSSSTTVFKVRADGVLELKGMTQSVREGLVSVNKGDLVYQTDGDVGLYHYDGTGWKALSDQTILAAQLTSDARQTLVIDPTVITNITLNEQQGVVLVDTSAGSLSVSLPPSAMTNRGRTYSVKLIAGANPLTLTPAVGQSIDGATNQILSRVNEALTLISDGSGWHILGQFRVVTGSQLEVNAVTSDKITDGSVGTADLENASITNVKLENDAVSSAKISDGTIVTADLADNSVDSSKIINDTILGADISASAAIAYTKLNLVSTVKGSDLVDGTVDTADLANDSVTTGKIINGTILAEDLASNSVTTAKITDGNVTAIKLSADAKQTLKLDATVKTGNYSATGSDGVILANTSGGALVIDLPTAIGSAGRTYTVKLTQGGNTLTVDPAGSETLDGSAVKTLSRTGDVLSVISDGTNWLTVSALADNAIVSSMISDGTIAANDLADNTVTTSKILDGTLADTDISSSAAIAHSKLASVTSGQILVGNGTNVATSVALSGDATLANTGALTIANNAITTGKILDGTLVAADMSTGAVTTTQILEGTIATSDIGAGAVTTTEILDGTVANTDISASAAIAYTKLNLASAVKGSDLVDGTVDTADLANDSVTTGKIINGTILAEDLASNSVTTAKITDGNVTAIKLSADAKQTLKLDATVKTGNYSATGSDGVILANTSGGAFVIDLPTAIGSAGRTYTVKLTQGGNTLTIDPAGSETLDGSAVKTLSRTGDVLSVISDGTNWLTVS
ncbi:hypothetical protein WDW89_15095, partial [Deltaproteobacteria bacterium TL4]